MGKGSGRRPTNENAFGTNYDKIFNKPPEKKETPVNGEKKNKTKK